MLQVKSLVGTHCCNGDGGTSCQGRLASIRQHVPETRLADEALLPARVPTEFDTHQETFFDRPCKLPPGRHIAPRATIQCAADAPCQKLHHSLPAPHLSGRAACTKPREAGVGFRATLLPAAILDAVDMAIASAGLSCHGMFGEYTRADCKFRVPQLGKSIMDKRCAGFSTRLGGELREGRPASKFSAPNPLSINLPFVANRATNAVAHSIVD